MEPLTLDQLLADAREELDDQAQPYLWEDPRLIKLYNEAIQEANLRARLIVDEAREDICRIALVPGQATYDLNPSVIVIRRAVLASRSGERLTRTKTNVLDECRSNWREERGRPEYVVRETRNRLTVTPVPTEADTLQLTVWRNPTEDEALESGSDDPSQAGIEAIHHPKLVHWVCFRALTKRDVEAEAPSDAKLHYELFETYFGPRPTAAQLERLAVDPITSSAAHFF